MGNSKYCKSSLEWPFSNLEKRLLFALPVLSAVTYLPALFMSQLLRVKLICFLSMTSLACTGFILMFRPIAQTLPSNYDEPVQQLESESTPKDQYLSYLNGFLCVLILLNAAPLRDESNVHDGFWLLCILPFCRSMKKISA